MKKFRLTLQGTTPLLMHNARLADPLDEFAKDLRRISSKRNKTEDDHLAMSKLEYFGGLYLDSDAGPFIPGPNIAKCLYEGATMNRLGTKVQRGVQIITEVNPLSYVGPRTAAELWESQNFYDRASVVVGQNRIQRTRPMFREWKTEAEGWLDESQLDLDQLSQIAENAGTFFGLGDARRLGKGRFIAKVEAI